PQRVRISTASTGIPSLSPTREEFRDLAGQGNLVPVFAELPADLDTPLSAYLRLRPGPYSFLLESVEGGEVWARYSFLGTDPLMVLSAKDGVSTLRRGNANAHIDKRAPASLDRAYDRAAVRIGMTLAKLARPMRGTPALALPPTAPLVARGEEGFTSTMDEPTFCEAVRRGKEFIAAG